MSGPSAEFDECLATVTAHIQARHHGLSDIPTLPTPDAVQNTISQLPAALPTTGLGTKATTSYLMDTLLPGCLQAQNGPRYFGFVVGGTTEASQLAEILGGSYDENAHSTLPGVTASSAIEQRTLEMILDLLAIPRDVYGGRTLTTGATASNVLGLACARDHLYANSPHLPKGYSYAQEGPPSDVNIPGPPIVLLTLHPHFSLVKSAGLVGLGSGPRVVQTMPSAPGDELAFDLDALRDRLEAEKKIGRGVIVCYGMGEVNTGGFGRGLESVAKLSREYGAWLHVDAAFGGFAAVVPEFRHLTKGIDLADSLTLDGHKWLNVPYDCGIFFTRTSQSLLKVFAPPAASAPAYLSAGINSSSRTDRPSTEIIHELVPIPLYVNIENSRRFRALPLFASLLSLGQDGYADIVRRNVLFARKIATYISISSDYELLNSSASVSGASSEGKDAIVPLNIVLFRGSATSKFPPTDPTASARLAQTINDTRIMYVSGTKWRGQGSIRLAVSNWRTGGGGEEEFDVVRKVFEQVMQ
ncbi:hypothetical protein BCR39DRAFT_551649 [Naematelia encephala]|uniref:Pyridoxal phosphate-dependent transferase n=1 Tax=Naematelia encephala TaxID=71784 RepID=A0A1Y2AIN3_9TREE|nr:hypothetical protein BCR39DRAFT_551649 [Naematelia encephala]